MKNLNLKEFFGSTVLAFNPDGRTTVKRRSNDGHIRRHLPVGLTKLLSLLFLLTLGVGQMWAGATWIGNSFIVANGTWYNGSGSGQSAGAFNNKALGTISSLTLGGEVQTYGQSDGKGNPARMHYQISGKSASYITLNWLKYANNNNYFQSLNNTISISSLASGSYNLSVWFEQPDGNKWDSNDNQNYVATFKIAPPAVKSSSVSVSATNTAPGSGTGLSSGSPIILINNMASTLTISAEQDHTDANSALWCQFGTGSYSSTTTYNIASGTTTTNQTLALKVKYRNNSASLDGAETTATIYYKWAAPAPAISFGSVSPAALVSGNGVTLVGTRYNSSNDISFQYTTNNGSTWTDISPKTSSLSSNTLTATWTVPEAHGATQTYKFRAKLAEATPIYSSASSAVSVYGKKTIHVKNTNNWGTLYLYAWDGEGTQLNGAWPGKTGVGSNGLSCTKTGGQWWDVVITSQVSKFILNANVSGDANQTADLLYTTYTDDICLAIGTGSGKRTLTNTAVTCPTVPTSVTTTATPTSVTNVQMTLEGSIGTNGNDNITDYGFYYGTTSACATRAQIATSNKIGAISKQLTGLTAGTTYYFKAYATNGQGTSYGDVQNYKLPYKVTVSTNTGCESITNSGTNYTNSTIEVTATKTTGYTFSSWTTTKGTQTSTSSTSTTNTLVFTPSADNATIQPVYTENMTTVNLIASPTGKGTFTSGGDPVTSVSAGVATKPTVTAVPATGYRLTGTIWSESSDYISITPANAAATTITATGTTGNTANLTATFTPITYIVHFNGNGATSGEMSNQTGIAYDAATTLTANAFVKTGYNFAGWATSAERANAGNVDRTDGAAHGNLSSTQGVTVNLYAVWTPKQSALSFDYQSSAEGHGTNGSISAVSATYGAAMPSLTGSLPTAANGYAFMGFYDAIGGTGTQYYDGTGASVTNWDKDTDSPTNLYAYYKKAEITTLALSAGTVLPEGSVTATPTIEPTPTGTHKICWKLLYNNGTEYSPQPTFTPGVGNAVSFPAPTASGTYKVRAQLRTGSECGAGTLLSERTTSFVVAGTHNVTIQYKCGDQIIKPATTVEGVKPLEWSEKITPGEAPFGYTFTRWEAGDGVTISTDGSSAIDGTTTTEDDIYIKAIYDGRLTAVYTKKNIIYFKNTLGWSDVYAHFLGSSYWDTSNGTGNNGRTDKNKQMTRLGETDIWYFDYGAAGITPNDYLVFTDRSYNNWSAFNEPDISTKPAAPVVYPIIRDNTEKNGQGYGFNAGTPMFVPVTQDGIKKCDNKAIYFNNGYWRAYDPTTGESGSTGYTLKIYNKTEDSSRELLQSIPFTNTDASGQIFKASINLEAAKEYGIMIERDNSMMYTNIEGRLNRTGDVVTMAKGESNYKAIYILTTAAGDYDFIITCNGSGQLCLQATFPAAKNDYRVLYTDNATWSSNTAHVKETWVHPSRVISAEVGATDTISFFVSKGNSPEYKIQKVSSINEGTGAITWTDVTSWTSISVDKTGVYNFIFTQPSAGSISLSKTEAYTGNYYIRTDNAGSTKWENYREEDHKMTYSEYAAKITHTGEEWKDFTHYFMKYVDKDTESGKYKNVKFTVANDYSPCISDTLVQQTGDTDITPNHVNDAGDLQASANIRFMWNIKNNKLQRAYLAAAQTDGSKFLVLQGQSGKLLAPDGTALSDANGNNHRGGTDAIQFTDKEHWMYEAEVKAVPGGRVKLYATYHGGTFYYYGDNTASFTGTSAIDLVTGDDEEAQTIRVVYDFKTDRLMAAWVPSEETIENEKTVNADIMLIREHQGQGHQINLKGSGSIKTNKTVYGVLRFNRWTLNNKSTAAGHAVLPVDEQKSQYERFNYMISFPFDVKVGEIFGFGTIGRHYRIFYYDGLGRAQEGFFAERGDDNWRMIDDTDSILHANQGYLLQLNYIRMKDDNTETWPQANMNEVELYFPAMNEINTIKLENVEIPALGDAYKCKINLKPTYEAQGNPKADEADRRVKDSYWRCIGVPGFTSYEATADTWENFNWTTNAADMPYLYEWHMDDNKLSVVSSSTFTFKPMHAYLIQNGNSFTWRSVAVPSASSVVARRQAPASEDSYYEFYLEMSKDEEALDHTYVRLTNNERVTADFDFGQDLSKELNSGANIYTRMGYERLAANNLPMNNQTTIVPVGVTAAEEGEYTFAMPEGTNGTGVTLIDNETGTRTSLALTDYTVTLAKGTYDNRFVLEFSPVAQTPTGIEDAETVNRKSSNRKLLIDGILYIVKDGQVFDARGTKVK